MRRVVIGRSLNNCVVMERSPRAKVLLRHRDKDYPEPAADTSRPLVRRRVSYDSIVGP